MLQEKVALVTGASRGLGKHIALTLAANGCHLALAARNGDELSRLATLIQAQTPDINVFYAPCDLTSPDQRNSFYREANATLGDIDILINNAGTGTYQPFIEHSEHEISQILALNLESAIQLSHQVIPGMSASGYGHIINIASDLSHRPLANMAPYVASKYGLRGFSLSLLREVKNQGIKVSLVNPGIIDTGFNGGTEGSQASEKALPPEALADTILHLLNGPKHQVIDELTLHPLKQEF